MSARGWEFIPEDPQRIPLLLRKSRMFKVRIKKLQMPWIYENHSIRLATLLQVYKKTYLKEVYNNKIQILN